MKRGLHGLLVFGLTFTVMTAALQLLIAFVTKQHPLQMSWLWSSTLGLLLAIVTAFENNLEV